MTKVAENTNFIPTDCKQSFTQIRVLLYLGGKYSHTELFNIIHFI